MKSNFYTYAELEKIGLKSFGDNVLLSRKCSIYATDKISIGNNVRIDDFCILSGNICIGNYVHISAYSALYGKNGIKIGNYCGVSARSILYSAVDDFSGDYMISPLVPSEFTNVTGGEIVLENFSQIGANSVIMPSITFEEGAVCGAFSFVNKSLDSWTINVGIPIRYLKQRNKNILTLSKRFEDNE